MCTYMKTAYYVMSILMASRVLAQQDANLAAASIPDTSAELLQSLINQGLLLGSPETTSTSTTTSIPASRSSLALNNVSPAALSGNNGGAIARLANLGGIPANAVDRNLNPSLGPGVIRRTGRRRRAKSSSVSAAVATTTAATAVDASTIGISSVASSVTTIPSPSVVIVTVTSTRGGSSSVSPVPSVTSVQPPPPSSLSADTPTLTSIASTSAVISSSSIPLPSPPLSSVSIPSTTSDFVSSTSSVAISSGSGSIIPTSSALPPPPPSPPAPVTSSTTDSILSVASAQSIVSSTGLITTDVGAPPTSTIASSAAVSTATTGADASGKPGGELDDTTAAEATSNGPVGSDSGVLRVGVVAGVVVGVCLVAAISIFVIRQRRGDRLMDEERSDDGVSKTYDGAEEDGYCEYRSSGMSEGSSVGIGGARYEHAFNLEYVEPPVDKLVHHGGDIGLGISRGSLSRSDGGGSNTSTNATSTSKNIDFAKLI